MRLAYADPPYIGQAKKHYSHDPRCAEVDHKGLIEKLQLEYDGWALSLHSPSLPEILSYCPDGIRIAAWVKPFCSFKKNVNPAYAWEPVIFKPARKLGSKRDTVRDFLSCGITLKTGLAGAKPKAFCFWIFDLLAADPSDDFSDLFPGTGIVGDCWRQFQNGYDTQLPLFSELTKQKEAQ